MTRDIDKTIEVLGRLHGIEGVRTLEADFPMKTPEGERSARMRVGLAWSGNLQIELIQPISGYTDAYSAYLPVDHTDASPRLHHVAVWREDLAAMRAEVESLGIPVVFEGEGPGIEYVVLDARRSLGHYLEYVWATPAGWEMLGRPAEFAS